MELILKKFTVLLEYDTIKATATHGNRKPKNIRYYHDTEYI